MDSTEKPQGSLQESPHPSLFQPDSLNFLFSILVDFYNKKKKVQTQRKIENHFLDLQIIKIVCQESSAR